jgi:hypothetical protein
MTKCNPSKTPVDANIKLNDTTDTNKCNKTEFQSLLGQLYHLCTISRPDINFIVHELSKYSQNPSMEHFSILKRILRYLKGSSFHPITINKWSSECKINLFTDSDFAGDIKTRKSTSGIIVFVNDTPIVWRCQLQKTVSFQQWKRNLLPFLKVCKM